jgi:hypothetical protein
MPPDIKITTDLLYKGALVFALMDAVYIPLLLWRIKEETFLRMKWSIVIAAALVWFGIWSWAIGNFWETVYSYVFPAWAQTWVPWIALVVAGLVALVPHQTECHPHVLSHGRDHRKPDSHLGGLSRHCHQASHVAGSLPAGSDHHCILRIYLLLVRHPHAGNGHGLDWKQVYKTKSVNNLHLCGG